MVFDLRHMVPDKMYTSLVCAMFIASPSSTMQITHWSLSHETALFVVQLCLGQWQMSLFTTSQPYSSLCWSPTRLSQVALIQNHVVWRKMHTDSSDGRQLCKFEKDTQGAAQYRSELDLPVMASSVCNSLYSPFHRARRRS
jgi:hypothetical protein